MDVSRRFSAGRNDTVCIVTCCYVCRRVDFSILPCYPTLLLHLYVCFIIGFIFVGVFLWLLSSPYYRTWSSQGVAASKGPGGPVFLFGGGNSSKGGLDKRRGIASLLTRAVGSYDCTIKESAQ
uniref:Uncharacterized protein n=1 Tax=Trypanosoma congolense (strain IL3000) TaxID=1068625 RepID=G0US08_TRYCI|nr:hypothetical protein, unlikely [Trypanosoma congolense IL3000]